MEETIINKYSPEDFVGGNRLFLESQVKEMMKEYKELLINNWQKNEEVIQYPESSC